MRYISYRLIGALIAIVLCGGSAQASCILQGVVMQGGLCGEPRPGSTRLRVHQESADPSTPILGAWTIECPNGPYRMHTDKQGVLTVVGCANPATP